MGEFLHGSPSKRVGDIVVNLAHQAMPPLPSPTAIGAEIEGTFSKKDVNGANSASYMDYPSLLDGEHSADTRRRLQRRASRIHPHHSETASRRPSSLPPPPVDGGKASASPSR